MSSRRSFLVRGLVFGAGLCGWPADALPAWWRSPEQAQPGVAATTPDGPLPKREGSLKLLVLGDFGTGGREQYQLGEQMAKLRAAFPYTFVLTVGDNIYGGQRPADFKRKFEDPYKPLLDAGVKFYATLGNHDSREQVRYQLFNMNGRFFYSFKPPQQDVRLFALDTVSPSPEQITWFEKELQSAREQWKIVYFHHAIYSPGGRHGSNVPLQRVLEPLFVKYNVSVVFAGHDHYYARIKPQQGITYFVAGSGGKLRRGNIDRGSPLTARGFDTDRVFLAVEIDGDQMFFSAITRLGQVIDSGIIERRRPAEPSPGLAGGPPDAHPPSPTRTPPASASRFATRS